MAELFGEDGVPHDFYKPIAHRRDSDVDCSRDPGKTRQEFADECDINQIMERYERTGELPLNSRGEPRYVDVTGMPPDFQTAMNILIDAEAAFMQLPAKVRKEFDNDPVAFVEFAGDEANLDQMRAWGLAKPADLLPDAQRTEGAEDGGDRGGAPAPAASSSTAAPAAASTQGSP